MPEMNTDTSVVKLVIVGLLLLGVIILGGAVVLTALEKPVPDPIWTIGAGIVGAMSALLVSTKTTPADPTPNVLAGGELEPLPDGAQFEMVEPDPGPADDLLPVPDGARVVPADAPYGV